MKSQLVVIGMSRLVYPTPGTRRRNCHSEIATKLSLRATQKFDYSPQELSTIIEWLAIERQAL